MNLSLVLPCFNEEKNIAQAVEDAVLFLEQHTEEYELIVVNDGSTDGSARVLQQLEDRYPELKVLTHSENQGYGCAVRSGLDAATLEWLAFMDSDLQFKAEDFLKLMPHTEHYQFVTGRRRKRADPPMRAVTAKAFGLLTYAVLGVWVRDINCAMKLWHRSVWPQIRPQYSHGGLFNAEMFYRLKLARVVWKQVDVEHYPRLYGTQTGASLRVILVAIRDLFVLRLSK